MSKSNRSTSPQSVNKAARETISRAKRLAAAELQARADQQFAGAYSVFHAARCRLWEALAVLAQGMTWGIVFATEAQGSASARSENTAFLGGFKYQPERKPSGKKAGVRNLADYPSTLQDRASGWRRGLSDAAAELADRAHGYLEHVSLVSSVAPHDPQPLLGTRNGAPVFAGLWRGQAPPIEVLRLPALREGNNADLTGRIYARMDRWRAEVGDVHPRHLPLGSGLLMLDMIGGLLLTRPALVINAPGGLPEVAEGPAAPEPLVMHPLRCYLAARTVFWAQVSRLETLFLTRYLGKGLGNGPIGGATMPDKRGHNGGRQVGERLDIADCEDTITREDFAQELTPYTYRAMESWHPARGCFSTYYEFKVKHALRNLRAANLPRESSWAQEQDFMSGSADPYGGGGAGWNRATNHTDAPAGVGEALIRGLTSQPDGPDFVDLMHASRETVDANGAPLKPAQRRLAREMMSAYLADQAPGVATRQPRGQAAGAELLSALGQAGASGIGYRINAPAPLPSAGAGVLRRRGAAVPA